MWNSDADPTTARREAAVCGDARQDTGLVPTEINRQWILASRPQGAVVEADLAYREEPRPTIGAGQFLVRTLYVSVAPGLRGWLTGSPAHLTQAIDPYLASLLETRGRLTNPPEDAPPLAIGSAMRGPALGQVVESRHREFAVGDFVTGLLGWQDYCASDGAARVPVVRFKRVHPLPRYLGVLGNDGLSAYFGMLEVAGPREGETVLVARAAGATGSIAAQLASIRRCRVIGIAGGLEKRRWLAEELELDSAIDCESEDLHARLGELCPDGVNVYFDTAGGRTLEIVLDHMATWGRIALGRVSHEHDCDRDRAGRTSGPANLAHLITRRVRMEGFTVADYAPRYKEARRQLSAWLATGALRSWEHVHEGFENIPRAFLGLLRGAGIGNAMVKLADAPIRR